MGLRGPQPEHPELKLDRGNPGKRKVDVDAVPELEALSVAPPKGLKGLALAEWKRLAADLINAGILTIGDMGLFRLYCKLHAEVDALEKKISRVKFEDAQKLGYNNLLVKVRGQYTLVASRLGLSPTTRHAVKKVKGKKQTQQQRNRFFPGRREQGVG